MDRYRRSETVGNKLTQVFMSKAALGYMCIIVMASYLYRPECVPDASAIVELGFLQSLADQSLDEAEVDVGGGGGGGTDPWCDSIDSCCAGSQLCAGAATQLAHRLQDTLQLLYFPGGGVAYNRSRDANLLGFAIASDAAVSTLPPADCQLEMLPCPRVATTPDTCSNNDSGSTAATYAATETVSTVVCSGLHIFEYWTVVFPSTTVPGGFYVAVIDHRAGVHEYHAYNMCVRACVRACVRTCVHALHYTAVGCTVALHRTALD